MSGQDTTSRVRSAFARAAHSYDNVSRIYDEIGRRLLTHLDPMAIEPALVLDVGCGTTAMTRRMLSMGLDVHGLSPDETQKKNFTENLDAPFYHCRFEDFEPGERFDCLVMSESAQYIPYAQLFATAKKSLSTGGFLMICDYFVLDNARGTMALSGHNLTKFRIESKKNGFKLMEERG